MHIVKPKNMVKRKRRTYTLLIVVAIFILVVLFLFKPFLKQITNKQPNFNNLFTKTEQDGKGNFDKESRIITSPEFRMNPNGKMFKYKLTLPEVWQIERLFDTDNPKNLIVVRGKYIFDINTELLNDSCLFPEDKRGDGAYEVFDQYKTINTNIGPLRVGRNPIGFYAEQGEAIFRICQKVPNVNDRSIHEWKTVTDIGLIQYRVPLKYDKNIIEEMNKILQSIEYIEL